MSKHLETSTTILLKHFPHVSMENKLPPKVWISLVWMMESEEWRLLMPLLLHHNLLRSGIIIRWKCESVAATIRHPSTISRHPSTISRQPSTINRQLSTNEDYQRTRNFFSTVSR